MKLLKFTGDNVHFIYLTNLNNNGIKSLNNDIISSNIDMCLPLIYIVQNWTKLYGEKTLNISVITHNSQSISTNYNLYSASISGLNKLINNEHPNIKCKNIDFDMDINETLAPILLSEVLSDNNDDDIAYQNYQRYIKYVDHRSPIKNNLSNLDNKTSTEEIPVELMIESTGNLDSLFYRKLTKDTLKSNEIEIKITDCLISSQDALEIMGKSLPRVTDSLASKQALGIEYHGIITNIGNDVSKYSVNEEVIACINNGSIKAF